MMFLYTAISAAILGIVIYFVTSGHVSRFLRSSPRVEGSFRPEFRPLAEAFRKNIESGLDNGGSFAAFVKGELVVEMWGGYTDYHRQHYWKEYTVACVASVTKFVSSVTFATLVERGFVGYDRLVKDFWPEFAQNGKDHVTVRMLLSHQAGVIGLSTPIVPEMIKNDWETVEKILAEQTPTFPPGSGFAYHAYTFGLYIDALARRVDPKGRRIYQIFSEDIAKKFGIDFTIGLPKPEQYRLAKEFTPSIVRHLWDGLLTPDYHTLIFSYLFKQNPLFEANNLSIKDADKPGRWDDPDSLEIPFCSGSGYGAAGSLAKLTGILANGGEWKGLQLLKKETIDSMSTVAVSGYDMAMKRHGKRGAGVWILQNPKDEDVVGHPGYGGQMTYMDRKNRVGLAYVTNHLSVFSLGDDPRFKSLEKVFYECLDKIS